MRIPLFILSLPLFITAADAQWEYGWARQSSSTTVEHGTSCAVAPDGHVAVTGSFIDTLHLGSIVVGTAPGNGIGGFVACYDATGNLEWAHGLSYHHPSGGNCQAWDVAVDAEGNVFAGGAFSDSLFLDTQTNFNFFLGRFDGGTGALSGLLTGPVVAELPGLGMGSDDVPALCGTFAGGPIDLGDELSGSWNMFVARLQPADVGILEQALDGIVMDLAPNPAHGAFKLRMGHAKGALDVDIIDACGAVVLARTFDGLTPMVELNVPPGLYLVRAMDKAGHVAEGRLVEQ